MISVLVAVAPDAPTAVTFVTDGSANSSKVQWKAPGSNGGSEVTAYKIEIMKKADKAFVVATGCEEKKYTADSDALYSCTVAHSVLKGAPFNWAKGDLVDAKVYAKNAFDYGAFASPTKGAVIATAPSAATAFKKDSGSDSTKAVFTWTNGDNGGTDFTKLEVFRANKDSDDKKEFTKHVEFTTTATSQARYDTLVDATVIT